MILKVNWCDVQTPLERYIMKSEDKMTNKNQQFGSYELRH
jgi:hypothetical protein